MKKGNIEAHYYSIDHLDLYLIVDEVGSAVIRRPNELPRISFLAHIAEIADVVIIGPTALSYALRLRSVREFTKGTNCTCIVYNVIIHFIFFCRL